MESECPNSEIDGRHKQDTKSSLLLPDIPVNINVTKARYSRSDFTDLNISPGHNCYLMYSIPEFSQFKGLDQAEQKFDHNKSSVSGSQYNTRSVVNETTALRPKGSGSTFNDSLTVQGHCTADKKAHSKQEWESDHFDGRTSSVLGVVDTIVVFLCIGPLVSVFWYSTWTLCDRYFFSRNLEISYWLSAGLGFTVITLATLLQNQMLTFSSKCCKPVRYILMRVFSYVTSVASINQWRAVWDLEDYYTGISSVNALLTYVLTTVMLLFLRGQRSVLTPPTTVSVDVRHDDHYKMTTFNSVPPGLSLYFLLDTLFTVLVFEPLTISVWRGLWELADCQLYPDDKQARAICCLVSSYGLAFILASLQVQLRRVAAYLEQVDWYMMLAFEDVIIALYAAFTILSWRVRGYKPSDDLRYSRRYCGRECGDGFLRHIIDEPQLQDSSGVTFCFVTGNSNTWTLIAPRSNPYSSELKRWFSAKRSWCKFGIILLDKYTESSAYRRMFSLMCMCNNTTRTPSPTKNC